MGHKTAGRSFIWCQINGLNSWRTTENKRWRAPTKIWIDLVLIICKCDLCNVHTLGSEYDWEYFEKYLLVSLLMDWLLWLGLNSVTSESELFNQESEQTFWSNENSFYHSGNFLQAPWLVFQARIPQMLKWRKMLVWGVFRKEVCIDKWLYNIELLEMVRIDSWTWPWEWQEWYKLVEKMRREWHKCHSIEHPFCLLR